MKQLYLMLMMTDSHCHLTDKKFENVEEVIEKATNAGITRMIVPGTDIKDIARVNKLTERFENVYGLAGIYPGNVEEIEDLGKVIEAIEKAVDSNKKLVGIGEIGLDCYWTERNIDKQKLLFKAQLELALKKKLPVVIHSRKSEGPIRKVFEQLSELPPGQFHCFGESEEFLKYVLERGFYVSFCGNITYKSTDYLRKLLQKTPLDRLLLETDSPYLPPEGKRGSVNEPANVKIIAEYIARFLNIDLTTLINQTERNTQCLFFDR